MDGFTFHERKEALTRALGECYRGLNRLEKAYNENPDLKWQGEFNDMLALLGRDLREVGAKFVARSLITELEVKVGNSTLKVDKRKEATITNIVNEDKAKFDGVSITLVPSRGTSQRLKKEE